MMLGDVVVAWLLMRSAEIAGAALDRTPGEAGLPASERAFYEGKIAASNWFARTRLPDVAAARAVVESTDDTLMALDPDAL